MLWTAKRSRRDDSTSRRIGTVIALAAVIATAAPAGAAAATSPPNPDVPYAATVAYRISGIDIIDVKFTVLTVARTKGATVVYYALTDAHPGGDAWAVAFHPHLGSPYRAGSADDIGLVDAAGGKLYMPLAAGQDCLCGIPSDLQAPRGGAEPVVGFAVMPELPRSVTRVSVQIGGDALIPDVPVAASVPAGPTSAPPVPLGSWPVLPDASRIAEADPALVTLDLTQNVADEEKSVSTNATSTSAALNSDVLFAFGESTLTPKAASVLSALAADIDAHARGPVAITGYTDDVGTDVDNLALSERRAQAVLDALTPLVKNQAITFTTAGKGEQDPVADNATDDGRALNRRVTVTYTTEGAK